MNRCLSPDEFTDAVDGVLAQERRAHVDQCAACRQTLDDLREALAIAGASEVPEPPAHFWPAFNARVRGAIADAPVSQWRAWLRWEVLVPMGGLALLVLTLASAVDRAASSGPEQDEDIAAAVSAAADGLPADGTDDDALALMEDLAASSPEGSWDALGVVRLPDLDVAAATLTADEQAALTLLLQLAVERPKS